MGIGKPIGIGIGIGIPGGMPPGGGNMGLGCVELVHCRDSDAAVRITSKNRTSLYGPRGRKLFAWGCCRLARAPFAYAMKRETSREKQKTLAAFYCRHKFSAKAA